MLIHVCVHVCVAPPMVVGAWSMAGALRQLLEYYYYPYIFNVDGKPGNVDQISDEMPRNY